MERHLQNIANLTDKNEHGRARSYITMLFPYLDNSVYRKKFDLIDDLHRLEGHMPKLLSDYRDNLTLQMLHEIEKHEGFEVKNKILAVI